VPDVSIPHIQENAVRKFLDVISNATICSGVESSVSVNDTVSHVIRKTPTVDPNEQSYISHTVRSNKSCSIFIEHELDSFCRSCKSLMKEHTCQVFIPDRHNNQAAKSKAPLSACRKESLIMITRESILKCNQLENELKRLKKRN